MFSDHGKLVTAADIAKQQRDEGLAKAYQLVALIEDSFVGGSVLIDKYAASDIDVVVPEWQSGTLDIAMCLAFSLMQYDPTNGGYEQDSLDNEIKALYHGTHGINVIVVTTEYYPAYKAGVLEYLRNPEKYKEKSVREALHKDMKKNIRHMLDGTWMETWHEIKSVAKQETINGMPVHAGFTI